MISRIKSYFSNNSQEIPTIDGKIIELYIDVLGGDFDSFNNYAKALFAKPLYFDAAGNKVKNPEKYEKLSINSKMSIVGSNITGIIYTNKLHKAYNLSIEKGVKNKKGKLIVDLSDLCPFHNELHVSMPENGQFLSGVIKINQEIPFLSLKMN
jgi:hypothetical protein